MALLHVEDCGVAYGVEILFRVDTTPDEDQAVAQTIGPQQWADAVGVLRALQTRGVNCEDLYVLVSEDEA